MPNIFSKRPDSPFKYEYVSSKNLADLSREVNLSLISVSLGRGFYMLTQTRNEFDNINLIYDNIAYFGQLFIIKATQSRIVDIEKEDLIFIESVFRYPNYNL